MLRIRRSVLVVGFAFWSLACGGMPTPKIVWETPEEGAPADAVTDTAGAEEEVVEPGTPKPRPKPKPTNKPNTPTPQPQQDPPKPTNTASSTKGKGQIQVSTTAGVQLIVDGQPIGYDAPSGSYIADVRSGTHQIEIMNMLGKISATDTVNVPNGERVRYRYKKGGDLSLLGNVTATFTAPPPAPVAPAPSTYQGSIEITGLDASYSTVFVNGRRINSSNGSFILGQLNAGNHDLRVEQYSSVIYTGAIEVQAGKNHRCLLTYDNYAAAYLDCHWTSPAWN